LCRAGGRFRLVGQDGARANSQQPHRSEGASGAMSREDDIEPDGGGDDIFAAEYVLGMLSGNDRSLAALRMETEPALAALVDRWEVFFAPLASGYPAAEAPEGVGAK